MGQTQSETVTTDVVIDDDRRSDSLLNLLSQSQSALSSSDPLSPSPPSSSSSVETLFAEAMVYGNDENNETLDAKAQKALECPCVADLCSGLCGAKFSDAFICFLKSTAEEKGSDCVHSFVALQNCIKANPDAFSQDVLEENDVKKEGDSSQGYKIIPPLWSYESPSQKSKL